MFALFRPIQVIDMIDLSFDLQVKRIWYTWQGRDVNTRIFLPAGYNNNHFWRSSSCAADFE